MENISVVIPVYGEWKLAKKNIDSILALEEANVNEIIVVDDCSPELNPYTFENKKVKLIRNINNLGYAGTVNNGLKIANSNYILLLDSDAHLIKPVVKKLISMFKADRLLGTIGLTAIGEYGQKTGSFQLKPTILGYVVGQAAEAKLGDSFNNKQRLMLPFSCCLAFRKSCLQEVEYFDDVTFPQVESDVDLGIRIFKAGWKTLITNDLVVYHQGGNSYKVNSKRVRLYHQAKWKLLLRHYDIKYPKILKYSLALRVRLEIGLMQIMCLVKSNGNNITEKLLGRKQLLEDIRHY